MANEEIPQSRPVVTRAEAKKLGLKRYFTGKPCGHGHLAERFVSSVNCTECARLRVWHTADTIKREAILRRTNERRRYQAKLNPHFARDKQRARMERKAGRPRSETCEICGTAAVTQFDHCHETNKFRGWICRRCNSVLGLVSDSTDLLDKLKVYLQGSSNGNI